MIPAPFTKYAAELFGTFWLVLGGCGTAVFAAKQVAEGDDKGTLIQVGVGYLGVALAFGLTVVTMAYALAHISGAHFNPAISLGAAVSGRLEWKDLPGYWIAQVAGGLLAGLAIYGIAQGKPGWTATGNMAANGYGDHSPGHYTLAAVLIAEILLTRSSSSSSSARPTAGPRRDSGRWQSASPSHSSPGIHPDLQHLGEPGTLDGGGVLQRRRRARPAVGVLGRPTHRRYRRRPDLSTAVRGRQVQVRFVGARGDTGRLTASAAANAGT